MSDWEISTYARCCLAEDLMAAPTPSVDLGHDGWGAWGQWLGWIVTNKGEAVHLVAIRMVMADRSSSFTCTDSNECIDVVMLSSYSDLMPGDCASLGSRSGKRFCGDERSL